MVRERTGEFQWYTWAKGKRGGTNGRLRDAPRYWWRDPKRERGGKYTDLQRPFGCFVRVVGGEILLDHCTIENENSGVPLK